MSRRQIAEDQQADDDDTGEDPGDGGPEPESTALPRAGPAVVVAAREVFGRIVDTDESAVVGLVYGTGLFGTGRWTRPGMGTRTGTSLDGGAAAGRATAFRNREGFSFGPGGLGRPVG